MKLMLAFVLVTLFASYIAYSFSVSTIYGPSKCAQINESYLTCPDSVPIKVTFSISALSSYPYLGNFTVFAVQYWNTSEVMNVFASGPCVVPWGGSTTCLVYLSPVPATSLNGTIKRNIPLKLVSSIYPQVSFNSSINITISHYITSGEAYVLNFYNTTNSRLASLNSTYSYFCKLYNVCSPGVSYNLSLASGALSAASSEINNSNLYASFVNITAANETINNSIPSFTRFTNSSNKIVNNIIKARYLLANITNTYYLEKEALSKCSFYNGTKYSAYLNKSINSMNSYPTLNTLNGSEEYLSALSLLKSNETNLINSCKRMPSFAANLSTTSGFHYLIYIFGIIIAILIIYTLLRINENRQVSKERSKYTVQKSEESKGDDNIGIKEISGAGEVEETGEESESTMGTATESYFDNWFSKTINNKGAEKKHEEAPKSEGKKKSTEKGKKSKSSKGNEQDNK
ncbi:MAG: hypothetical protein ACP5RT_02945 [Candidatus Micrarchaeia archaeon]